VIFKPLCRIFPRACTRARMSKRTTFYIALMETLLLLKRMSEHSVSPDVKSRIARRESVGKSGTEQEDGATHHRIEQDQQETLEPHEFPILGDLAEQESG
jgi:hypothetical protein